MGVQLPRSATTPATLVRVARGHAGTGNMPVRVTSVVRRRVMSQSRSRRGSYPTKRVLDIILTLFLLVPVGLLVIAVVALLIRLDSPGPIVFRQTRIGQDGTKFTLLKFRSMYHACEQEVHRQAIVRFMSGQRLSTQHDTPAPFKLDNDARITRVGRLLRRSSLDELPQLFNVLAGQMSLVGPRPPLLYEVALYRPGDWQRLSGKPGLTGMWQVYGRSRVSFETMVEMDLEYLRRQSLWLDLKLILLTLPAMLRGEGAA